MTVITALHAEITAATNRLLATAAGLSAAGLAAPSHLPGWTRGHVLAHLARNADGLLNLLAWARTGVESPQYPSLAARDAGIEEGARRTPHEHLADLEDGAVRLARAIREQPEPSWQAMVRALRPPEHPAWYVLVRRVRELEVHHADLGAGYGPADWPAAFVRRELHDCRAAWPYEESTVGEVTLLGEPETTWTGLGEGPGVAGRPVDVLAWLTGRSRGEGIKVVRHGHAVPAPPPWLIRPAPPGLPAAPPEDYP
ncbi:maleylpyruvate isomerase family mycothiol-dependent enzyme [Nonomuraea typhae]|uniref:maleylpyruvate isomerase family mycothiol-dependent enzyme n=1 Tax=Nonomuraea typhae TaxID=2603600 RepID=UPI0012F86176|nr:maleylpyruvate isomerase family mycothiol-dependent enzyme [Nonomuraea typhae]